MRKCTACSYLQHIDQPLDQAEFKFNSGDAAGNRAVQNDDDQPSVENR